MGASSSAMLRFDPDYAVAAGATLRSTLAEMEMTQSDLAARTGLSVKHINQIVQGIAPITHETALAFEKVTGVPASVWNRLEANYRDRLARLEDRHAGPEDAEWLETLPIKELIRRGVITKTKDAGALLDQVYRFFGVANRRSWERVWREPLASFRKSPAFASDAGAVATWLRLGELEAVDIDTAEFDPRRFRHALQEIRALTREDPRRFQEEMIRLCAESGVALVFMPEITGTRASGAAHWLTATKAIIQLSLRYKADDHLWFSFFHEAAHILLHSRGRVHHHHRSRGRSHRRRGERLRRDLPHPQALRARAVRSAVARGDLGVRRADRHRPRDRRWTAAARGDPRLEPGQRTEETIPPRRG